MPYIKRIEINGFKTFGLKTTLTFDRGFTVITGPNGSGKTNIMDAVLFCLGELSAKRLRAENFSALIFNGGENSNIKKNRAKVLIQFDNSDGRLPVETATVTISREIDKKGESIYRINGRRVPRSHLLEVLSVAGISPYGHNIIPQGMLTRMAEISTHERRKIIEDMLGIAQYDAEKAKAEVKLKEADMSIKTALGQISEVQKRVESLERERNNLLRYNFIKREINYLESIKISREIRNLQSAIKKVSQDIANLEEKNKRLLESRESLRLKRREIESELRKLGFEETEEKRNRIVEIQINIGSLKSRLNDLSAKIRNGKANIERLKRLRENLQQQSKAIIEEIKNSEDRIKQLNLTLNQLDKKIKEKQASFDYTSKEISKIRSTFEQKAKKVNELEKQLNQLHEEKVNIEGEYARIQSRISVYSQRLEDLKKRRKELKASYRKLRESLIELQEIVKKQAEQLRNLQATLERKKRQRALLEKEIKEAERIAEVAREALVEFEAQKNLIQKIGSEEVALKSIEELGSLGVIEGIHGRLRNLIKIRRGYERAVEAAASGWLNSLVVENLDVAFTCIETLKRMKLGRVKIIPLNGLSLNNKANNLKAPNIEGVKEKIISFVKCERRYEPAVNFVLGDTLLALSEDSAIRASKEGFRVVTLSGDLYEAGGGVESGFHRTPIDLSSFVPSEKALKSLDRAVKTLKSHLENRENIIAEIEEEITKNQSEIVDLSESTGKLESEVSRVRKSIAQTESNIKQVENKIANLSSQIEKDKAQISSFEIRLNEINKKENLLKEELRRVRDEIDLLKVHDAEARREEISREIISLKENYNNVESEISTLKSKIENVLKRSLENLSSQIDNVSNQISTLEKEVDEALKEKEETQKMLGELERKKEEIARELVSVKEESKKFTSQIDALDNELTKLDKEYEESMRELNELRLKMQAMKLQMNRCWEQLKIRGYESPLDESQDILREKDVDKQLELMRKELKSIGAVNQLAEVQYAEQVSRYKELSVRLNELEREKLAILKFIEEIEQKKYKVFMDAFNKINERINLYFSKLTGGGNASLKLENPENPFAGGVDMIVQFPGKSPILVSGASSGERSVSAVAFLFALQEFSPASFYLFDEIDAHLDAFHVERLGELLSEEASKSELQFIIITLKPEMISKADRIYGVYSQNGISHIVSTTFKGAT
ncbi:chromosome segregation protein SMC [Candidatus Bathyarchaeota archaeon]|nr:chromosome segregation protein SMC [Candidatus Bathyarchaeota archaeon]